MPDRRSSGWARMSTSVAIRTTWVSPTVFVSDRLLIEKKSASLATRLSLLAYLVQEAKKARYPLSTSLDGDDLPVTSRCTTSIFRLVWAALALVQYCAPSAAGPAENNVIGAFESFCLDNLNAPDRAIRLIDALGLAEIPDPERAILMADHPGRA